MILRVFTSEKQSSVLCMPSKRCQMQTRCCAQAAQFGTHDCFTPVQAQNYHVRTRTNTFLCATYILLLTASAIPQVHMLVESNRQYQEARAQENMKCSGFSADNYGIRRLFLPLTCSVRCVRTLLVARERDDSNPTILEKKGRDRYKQERGADKTPG